jgi:hypothetical protein
LGIFTAIWYKLWPFGIVCGHLVYFSPFWYAWTNTNLATLVEEVVVVVVVEGVEAVVLCTYQLGRSISSNNTWKLLFIVEEVVINHSCNSDSKNRQFY